jgi:hypothetical protein
MESISERIIKLSLIYTFTSSGIQAIKFLNHGRKQIVYKPFNPWKTFSVIALVGIGLWAITK